MALSGLNVKSALSGRRRVKVGVRCPTSLLSMLPGIKVSFGSFLVQVSLFTTSHFYCSVVIMVVFLLLCCDTGCCIYCSVVILVTVFIARLWYWLLYSLICCDTGYCIHWSVVLILKDERVRYDSVSFSRFLICAHPPDLNSSALRLVSPQLVSHERSDIPRFPKA